MNKADTERLLYLLRSDVHRIEITPAGALMFYPEPGLNLSGTVEVFTIEKRATGGPIAPGTYDISAGSDPEAYLGARYGYMTSPNDLIDPRPNFKGDSDDPK